MVALVLMVFRVIPASRVSREMAWIISDLSEPISPDFDLVAEFILQSSYQDALEMLEDKSPVEPEEVFSKILGKQFEPLDAGLRNWNEQGE